MESEDCLRNVQRLCSYLSCIDRCFGGNFFEQKYIHYKPDNSLLEDIELLMAQVNFFNPIALGGFCLVVIAYGEKRDIEFRKLSTEMKEILDARYSTRENLQRQQILELGIKPTLVLFCSPAWLRRNYYNPIKELVKQLYGVDLSLYAEPKDTEAFREAEQNSRRLLATEDNIRTDNSAHTERNKTTKRRPISEKRVRWSDREEPIKSRAYSPPSTTTTNCPGNCSII